MINFGERRTDWQDIVTGLQCRRRVAFGLFLASRFSAFERIGWRWYGADLLASLGAVDYFTPGERSHLHQGVQLNPFVERRSGDVIEVIAKHFPAPSVFLHGTLATAGFCGGLLGEAG
jgi:hypothetical protein